MKKIMLLFTFVVISKNVLAVQAFQSVTLDEMTQKVKFENYRIQENASRVYQAKQSIEEARGRMLPSLNVWKLAKMIVDPAALLDGISDIAPFLVPANWYVLQEREILFYAEKEGYRALWGDEVHTARSLYYKTLLDHQLLYTLSGYKNELRDLLIVAQSRVSLGFERPETAKEMEIRHLAIQEDIRNMTLLVNEERNILSYMMGLPAESELIPADVNIPHFSEESKVVYEILVGRLVTVSPEKKQYEHFLKVIPLIKREMQFSFLGGSTFSRGVAGGVFDRIPDSPGFGFGTGPALNIVDTQGKILELQKKGVVETIKRQLKSVVDVLNSAIDLSPSQIRRKNLSEQNVMQIKERILMGEKVNIIDYADIIHSRNISHSSWLEFQFRYLMAKDKLNRLLFWNEYDMAPAGVERIRQ